MEVLVEIVSIAIFFVLLGFWLLLKKPSKKWKEKAEIKYKNRKTTEEKEAILKLEKEKKVIAKEIIRTQRESCTINTDLETKALLPSLIAIILLFIGIYIKYITYNFEFYLFFPTCILGLMYGWFEALKENWNFILNCKKKIYEENKKYPYYSNYEPDMIYTDSYLTSVIFRLFNTMLWISNALIIMGIIVGLGYVIREYFIQNRTYFNDTNSLLSIIIVLLFLNLNKKNK